MSECNVVTAEVVVEETPSLEIETTIPMLKGDTPYIGENGNWWISGTDTGVAASGGSGGASTVVIDSTPTENSNNAVSSGGVYDALQNIEAETVATTGDINAGDRVIAEGYIRSKSGNVFTNDGNVYTSGGDMYTTKGEIYSVEGDIRAYNGSFYKGSGDDKVEVAYKDELSTLPTTTYDGTIDMQSGVSYVYETDATEVSFSLASVADGNVGIYSLTIAVGDDVPTFSYPSALIWVNGELSLEANTTYELNILNGVVTYISYSNE